MDPSLTLSQLATQFVPYTNATIFATGKFRNYIAIRFDPAERRALRTAWFALAWRHTGAYLEHRGRLGRLLFGWNRDRLPDHLVFNPDLHHLDGNPRVASRWGPLHVWVRRRLDRWVDTPLFAGWIYLLAGGALVAVALKRRRSGTGGAAGLALATAASGVCYALPLLVLSPSADFRYLGWPVLSVPLAALCLLPARPSAGGAGVTSGRASSLDRKAPRPPSPTQLCYARHGVVTEEMHFVAEARKHRAGDRPLRSRPRPHDHSRQHQSHQSRADVHRRRLQVQDQFQHRQLRGTTSNIDEELEKLHYREDSAPTP